jgi:hypothetical protein
LLVKEAKKVVKAEEEKKIVSAFSDEEEKKRYAEYTEKVKLENEKKKK